MPLLLIRLLVTPVDSLLLLLVHTTGAADLACLSCGPLQRLGISVGRVLGCEADGTIHSADAGLGKQQPGISLPHHQNRSSQRHPRKDLHEPQALSTQGAMGQAIA